MLSCTPRLLLSATLLTLYLPHLRFSEVLGEAALSLAQLFLQLLHLLAGASGLQFGGDLLHQRLVLLHSGRLRFLVLRFQLFHQLVGLLLQSGGFLQQGFLHGVIRLQTLDLGFVGLFCLLQQVNKILFIGARKIRYTVLPSTTTTVPCDGEDEAL
ncbi:hypothetical protein TYRP_017723 [Tyrophagus putrescentiae]|nr:hypothetical protein TYRP_017723 [Tyrophagus putrescentiae]